MLRKTFFLIVACAVAVPALHAQPRPSMRLGDINGLPQAEELSGVRAYAAAKTAAAQARLEKMKLSMWNEDAWSDEMEVRYVYENGLQVEATTYQWEESAWEPSSSTRSTYADGRLTEQQYDWWNGSDWEPTFRMLNSYTSGTFSQTTTQNWMGDEWVDESRTTYDISGSVIIGGLAEEWDGSVWQPIDRFTLQEEDGNVVEIFQEHDGSGWVNMEKTIYLNLTLAELLEWAEDAMGEGEFEMGLGLGTEGPDTIVQYWNGTTWVNESRQTTVFDDDDRPLFVFQQSWEAGWVDEGRQAFEYDAQGRLVRSTMDWPMDDEWSTFMASLFDYDADGDLLRLTQQMDLGFGMMNLMKVDFTWDKAGTAVEDVTQPAAFMLDPAYPNPFNPSTRLTYRLDHATQVSLRAFDLQGRVVATLVDGVQPAGAHSVRFDAAGLPSGTYLIRLEAGSVQQTQKVVLAK